MSAGEPSPFAGAIAVERLLRRADRQSAAFNARLSDRARRAPDGDRNRDRTVEDARALRDDIRQTRASIAAVQAYLREQADLLHRARRTERKLP